MIGFDICRLLSYQNTVYENLIGLFQINELPEKIGCHKFAIINDSHHWAVIHKTLFNQIEVFDSLGTNSSISKKVKNNLNCARNFAFNSTQLQSDNSSLCGEFAIFCIVNRFYDDDIEFSEFLNQHFSSNHKRNEKRVVKFIKKLKYGRL